MEDTVKILGMGGFEFVIILIVVLIIFGPKNLPKLGNAIGRTVSNLRSGMNAGKKKDADESETSAAEGTAAEGPESVSVPAEIEGQVEEVTDGDAGADADGVEEAEAAVGDGDDADMAEAADDSEGARKVKRVVRKKVDSAE